LFLSQGVLDIYPKDRRHCGWNHRVFGAAPRMLLPQSASKDSQVYQQINKDKEKISQGLKIRLTLTLITISSPFLSCFAFG